MKEKMFQANLRRIIYSLNWKLWKIIKDTRFVSIYGKKDEKKKMEMEKKK